MTIKKVAIVGLGNISSRHRKNIKQLYPEAIIYAVSASGKLPEDFVQDADFIKTKISDLPIDEMNLAIIASPSTLHATHAIEFINHGVPTLIEKPLAASVIDAVKIYEAQQKNLTPVAVGYCLRYLSSALKVKELLEEGIIGQVYNVFSEVGQYLPDWRPSKNYKTTVSASKKLGGGALLELSHELDYLSWLFGELQPVGSVLRTSSELGLDVEDSVDILAKADDIVFSIHLDFLQKKAHRKCRIIGSSGVLEWNLLTNQVLLIKPQEVKNILDDSDFNRNQMYLDMVLDFENYISGKPNTCIKVKDALKTIQLITHLKKFS